MFSVVIYYLDSRNIMEDEGNLCVCMRICDMILCMKRKLNIWKWKFLNGWKSKFWIILIKGIVGLDFFEKSIVVLRI